MIKSPLKNHIMMASSSQNSGSKRNNKRSVSPITTTTMNMSHSMSQSGIMNLAKVT